MKTTTIPAGLPEIENLVDGKIRDYVLAEYGATTGDFEEEELNTMRLAMENFARTVLRSHVPVSLFKEGDEAVAKLVFAKVVEVDQSMEEVF